ncbi:MAG: pentapeptide repeat-containing protein [Myxococcota bacterium]
MAAAILHRWVRIGLWALLAFAVPAAFTVLQTCLAREQNELAETQNELVLGSNELLEAQNELVAKQNNYWQRQLRQEAAQDFRARRAKLIATIYDERACREGEEPARGHTACPIASTRARTAAAQSLVQIEADIRNSPEDWNPIAVKNATDLSRADLRRVDLEGVLEITASLSDLSEAALSGADLSDADLSLSVLNNAMLAAAKFDRAKMRQAELRGATIFGASFQDACLERADLQGVLGMRIDFHGAVLRGANLQGATLQFSDLRDADLSESVSYVDQDWWRIDPKELPGSQRTQLQGADLVSANLSNANLYRADLREASLWHANLQGADLRAADLRGANLADTELGGVICDEQTRWPEGLNAPDCLSLELAISNKCNR